MILVAAPVETDLSDPHLPCPLGNQAPDRRGRPAIAAVADLLPQLRVARAGRTQDPPRRIVDQLAVDVLMRAMDGEPRPLGGSPQRPADAERSPLPLPTDCYFVFHLQIPPTRSDVPGGAAQTRWPPCPA